MGCDIHMVLEQKLGNEWVGIHNYRNIETPAVRYGYDEEAVKNPSGWCTWRITDRNYRLFGELAGVRTEGTLGNQPLGLPEDMSQLTRMMAETWGDDGHSHSHLSLKDFVHAYCAATDQIGKLMEHRLQPDKESDAWYRNVECIITGVTVYEDTGDYRVCFFFDN